MSEEKIYLVGDGMAEAISEKLKESGLIIENQLEVKEQHLKKDKELYEDLRKLNTPQPVIAEHKYGRNEPCPCGSGKKYKTCHLAQENAEMQKQCIAYREKFRKA